MRGHRGSVLSLTAGNFIRQNEDLDESINQYIEDNKNSQKDELEINEHYNVNKFTKNVSNWSIKDELIYTKHLRGRRGISKIKI